MNKLFKDGKEFCEIKGFNFNSEKQKIGYINVIGEPRRPVVERKDMDRVTFVTSIRPELRSKHELRDDEGNIMSIIIEYIESKQNQFFVEAVIY